MAVDGSVRRCSFDASAAMASSSSSSSAAAPAEPTMAEMLAVLRSSVIEVEGNIGSGKSTLTHNLSQLALDEASESDFSVVHGEKVNPVFLKAFYENSQQYAFAFQMYMLTTRLYQIDEAHRQADKEGKLVFLDRGAVGDVLFALQNFKIGNMNRADMAVYRSVCTERLPASLAERVNAVVFLDVEPEVCWYRMTTVRQREAEEGVPLSYLDGIDSVYFHLLVDWLAGRKGGFHDMNIGAAPPVMVVRWDKFGCSKDVMKDLYKLVCGQRASPTVAFTLDEAIAPGAVDLTVDTAEQALALYATLKETDSLLVADAETGALRPARTLAMRWGLEHTVAFRKVAMYVFSEQGSVVFYGQDTAVETPEYNCDRQ
jgi:deoxyadenosine/deoxycytidine kinase